ncbi:hypothetical protein D3C77_651220 [compost metagenome]
MRVGAVEHFQVQLRAGEVTLWTTALQGQFGADLFPAIARVANDEFVGNEDVVQEHFVEVMLAEHGVDRSYGDTG